MPLHQSTRQAFTAYLNRQNALNGVPAGTSSFSVTPSVAQTLENHVRDKSGFLKLIPAPIIADETTGELVSLTLNATFARRTAGKRTPVKVGSLDGRKFETKPYFFDTTMPYEDLNRWAKWPTFQTEMRDAVTKGVANQRQMIGFHGTHAAAETDPVANPMLQDMGRGWLQYIRDLAPEQVMTGVKIGPGGDYETLDECVNEIKNTHLEQQFRKVSDLRCLADTDMITGKYNKLLRNASAVELEAATRLLESDGIANVSTLQPDYFPERTLVISPLSNFQIYTFERGYMRSIKDEPDVGEGQVSDYLNIHQDYVMRELGACAVVQGILLPHKDGGWVNAAGEIV